MGLITKEIMVKLGVRNMLHYKNLGYEIPKIKKWGRYITPRGTEILVKVEDLTDGSNVQVEVECDNCLIKSFTRLTDYRKCIHKDGIYFCSPCGTKIIATNKMIKTRLENGISFEQWCIENNKQNILDRWDYKLNKCKPNEVGYSSSGFNKKGYWFKCSKNIHKSELKRINDIVHGKEGIIKCKQCNSFAQWGIDNIGKDFLEKYWSNKNTINPWEIEFRKNKKIWIKCQEKDYHENYLMTCDSFVTGQRCPYCNNRWGKVHPFDSLGSLYPEVLEIWSDKNIKSSYDYAPKSTQKVWWKCSEGLHEDYFRSISSSNVYDFRCPECSYFKGEKRINEYLIKNNVIYIFQKEYDGLIGTKGGNLSYDFYLPNYNLLIEYQGNFHDGSGTEFTKINLNQQQEHDRRKREYAQNNNIELLEIWYWDYDNIEEILKERL